MRSNSFAELIDWSVEDSDDDNGTTIEPRFEVPVAETGFGNSAAKRPKTNIKDMTKHYFCLVFMFSL